jgi:hypothetical protein
LTQEKLRVAEALEDLPAVALALRSFHTWLRAAVQRLT